MMQKEGERVRLAGITDASQMRQVLAVPLIRLEVKVRQGCCRCHFFVFLHYIFPFCVVSSRWCGPAINNAGCQVQKLINITEAKRKRDVKEKVM